MSIRESNGERFNSIPEIAIISDEDLEHFYNIYKLEIDNTLRLSANFDILENNQTFYNDLNSYSKRLSTIQNADKISVIKDGALVEEGTHDELMQNETSFYFNLYSHSI